MSWDRICSWGTADIVEEGAKSVGKVLTNSNGVASFQVKPKEETCYFAQFEGKDNYNPSSSVSVKVQPKITLNVSPDPPKAGKAVTISGKVSPNLAVKQVVLTIAKSDGQQVMKTLDAKPEYEFTLSNGTC